MSSVSYSEQFRQFSPRHWRPAWFLGAVLAASLVGGCVVTDESDAPVSEESVVEAPLPPEMLPESVSDLVLTQASEDLGVPVAELSLLRVNKAIWPDGCLGLGRPDEGCLLALTEGWQVEVVYDEQSYFYRTNTDGSAIRRSTLESNLPPSIRDQVLAMAAAETGVPVEELAVVASEPQLWDGCLGVAEPNMVCPQIAIYGWRAVVEGGGETLVYHTDMTGDDIRLNDLE